MIKEALWDELQKISAVADRRVLPVPQLRQQTDFSCGASSLQAVLQFYGVDIEEDVLRKRLGTDAKDGTDAADMAALLREEGVNARALEGLGTAQLVRAVRGGNPVLVCFQKAPLSEVHKIENGHWAVVAGVSGNELLFMDPSGTGTVSLSIPQFEARWVDDESDGRVKLRLAVVCRGTPRAAVSPMDVATTAVERISAGREKIADHADDRLLERTDLDPSEADRLRAHGRTRIKGQVGDFFSPIVADGKHVGTAAYRTVGRKNSPVLTTILSAHMSPRGRNLGVYDPGQNKPVEDGVAEGWVSRQGDVGG